MKRVKDIGIDSHRWSRRVLLTLVLSGVLLLCHGFYGASHQIFSALQEGHTSHAPTAHADTHGAGVGRHIPVDRQDGGGEGHLGHVAYAAALLVISLGGILWLLSDGSAWTRSASYSLTEQIVPLRFLSPPPRPSPNLLQVFRL
jgi:hypothetical protein